MLSVKQRQEKLKFLGFYDGKIDGKVGPKTKKGYKDLQNKYFFRKKDKDGLYGKDTDILLQCVYNVAKYSKNFDILKDKLHCRCNGKYCTGYPAVIDVNLVKNLQEIRNKFGATTITSLLRCSTWNKIQGGVSSSKHTKGKGADYRTKVSNTLVGRKNMIDYWFTLSKPNYGYCNGYYKMSRTSGCKKSVSMGNSTHCDVK